MPSRGFDPRELLFSLTTQCNLNCLHCNKAVRKTVLSKKTLLDFLRQCAKMGIKRVGFTGGEPFLEPDLLAALLKAAVKHKMLFTRIMTNGAWFKTDKEMIALLKRLSKAGYDGDICVSVDAFHQQDLKKVSSFIKTASTVFNRSDMISIATVRGAMDNKSRKRLLKLARLLNGRLKFPASEHAYIKNDRLFIKIFFIALSPVGKAAGLKNPWDGKWFKDDLCKGPGNVFFVQPDGLVKPCCGYANENDALTIGSIRRNTPQQLLRNARKNPFVNAIFKSGLHPIRRTLEKSGVHFPGRTSNHCFFCDYIAALLKDKSG